jgi:hypothetical protein
MIAEKINGWYNNLIFNSLTSKNTIKNFYKPLINSKTSLNHSKDKKKKKQLNRKNLKELESIFSGKMNDKEHLNVTFLIERNPFIPRMIFSWS